MVSRVASETLDNFSIVGNHLKGPFTIYGLRANEVSELIVNDNAICDSGSGYGGLYLQSCDEAVVNGNRVDSSGDSGIKITDGNYFTITGNYIKDSTAHGIFCDNVDDLTINGNLCYSNGGCGIRVEDGDDIVIAGNICKENNDNDVNWDGLNVWNANNVLVYGNRCFDDRGTQLQVYGIQYYTVTDMRIFGNDFEDNLTGETNDAGSSSNVYIYDMEASTANADTSGATLPQLETEVNELKALLRDRGLLAT